MNGLLRALLAQPARLAVVVLFAGTMCLVSTHTHGADDIEFAPLENVVAVSTGYAHSCVIVDGGNVKCWGVNVDGRAGSARPWAVMTPQDVAGLSPGVRAIAAGGSFSCAIADDHSVRCWGSNGFGQLGDGSNVSSPTPVVATGLRAASISTGYRQVCAVTIEGGARCWGDNTSGQLGNGSDVSSSTPVDVMGLAAGVSSVATGWNHSCAVTSVGTVKCWGDGTRGQLGHGVYTSSDIPVDVSGLDDAVSVAAGDSHACALRAAGGVVCWGSGHYGTVGDGTREDRAAPVQVAGLEQGVVALSASRRHVCALMVDGTASCWGSDDSHAIGHSGLGWAIEAQPVVATNVDDAVAVAVGGEFTCALREDRRLLCWGYNGDGQLGYGHAMRRRDAIDVIGLTDNVIDIGASYNSACAVLSDGRVRCWGWLSWGMPGGVHNWMYERPVTIPGFAPATSISVGDYHACIVTTSGGVQCWGQAVLGDGMQRDGAPQTTPVDVVGLDEAVQVSSRGGMSCALDNGGAVKCWGLMLDDEMEWHTALVPVDVPGLGSSISKIATGLQFGCALSTSGGVKCWGRNRLGVLGDGSGMDQSTPVDVQGLGAGVIDLTANEGHACAVLDDARVQCWGDNSSGQLGDGTRISSPTPVDVTGLVGDIVAVNAGLKETCAIDADGGAQCWGNNAFAQLGNGSLLWTESAVPVNVVSERIARIDTGWYSTCALMASGRVQCWGWNSAGELGNDGASPTSHRVPVVVNRYLGPVGVFGDDFEY